jgi:predicted nucleic acid-binding protein
MTVLIDTDILLDIALKREPFFSYSSQIIEMCENNTLIGYLAWHTLSNFYYLVGSEEYKKYTREFISDLLQFTKVAPTNTESAKRALSMKISDFEDALQISAAISCNADYIITRNVKHYKKSQVPALTPDNFIKKML